MKEFNTQFTNESIIEESINFNGEIPVKITDEISEEVTSNGDFEEVLNDWDSQLKEENVPEIESGPTQ